MTLTKKDHQQLENGKAVPLTIDGKECVIVPRSVFEQDYDDNDWTDEERDLLAAEVDAMLDDDLGV